MAQLQPSARCKALIAESEDCHKVRADGLVEAYPDPASPMGRGTYPRSGPDVSKGAPWTIGFGATGPGITRGTVWPMAKCELRFDADIAEKAAGVRKLLNGAPTTQAQFDALVSFAFNCGLDIDADTIAEGLGDSTLLKKHLAGDFGTFDPKTGKGTGAAGEFGKWVKAQGKTMPGLVKRRAKEAALYAGH